MRTEEKILQRKYIFKLIYYTIFFSISKVTAIAREEGKVPAVPGELRTDTVHVLVIDAYKAMEIFRPAGSDTAEARHGSGCSFSADTGKCPER